MSRLRAQSGPTISLFPFLAVLLCTMGSLLVLLVIFSRSAQQADTAATAAAAAAAAEELLLARDELAWRIEQLDGVKARTEEDLARVRMQLAGIEQDARTLSDEFDALEQTAAALEAGAEPDAADEESLAELEQRLAQAEAELTEAKKDAADRPPAYAVVPFEGEAGTHRRPLYIECCIDGVFLQPEGIRLGPTDFEGPPGPGNPLASGLRAAREYIAQRPGELGEPAAQPYPLLLVRPSGVMAYYAARESLQSWGSDFGYQFVDEDWELTYPPADPALAEAENRAVAEARRRLEWLAQVRPAKRTRPAVQYRAATTRGGVVASGGPSVLGDQSQWDWTEEQAAAATRPGRGFRAGDGGDGTGNGGGDAILGAGGGGTEAGDQWAQAGGDGGGGPGSGSLGDRYRGPSKFYGGGGGDGAAAAGADGEYAAGGLGDASAGAMTGGSLAGGVGEPGVGGDAPAGHGGDGAGGGAGSSPSGEDGSLAGGGGGSGAAGSAAGAAGGAAGGSAGQSASQFAGQGGGGGNLGVSLPGMPQGASASAGSASGQAGCSGGSCSLAGRRGSNWASLASQDRPIPLTRPIRLECSASEFRILGAGGRIERRVKIDGDTLNAVDPLVRAVHATVGEWGMAGDRMYWKPELVLSATADGTSRRDDLEALLADSGLDTRRSGSGEQVRRLPPVNRTGGLYPSR
ncbi:MAG: hypothetical protein RLZZ440_2525 [Planctomycetota bacterium]